MRLPLFLGVLLFTISLKAQTAFDALRFSTFDVTATARNLAVGGAISGLGADFSSLSTNPAGLGAYRFSEFVVAPSFVIPSAEGILLDDLSDFGTQNTTTRFQLGNLGLVIVGNPYDSKWSNINFGIGVNKVASFAQQIKYEGSSLGSVSDRFLEQASGNDFNEFEAGLALDVGAVFDFDDDGLFESDYFFHPDVALPKSQTIDRQGSTSEFVIGVGGNFNEKLLVGFSLGVPFFSYRETKNYEEEDENNEVDFFENLRFDEELVTSGVGINAKLGVMFLLTKKVRLGLAIHTPTAYALQDSFRNELGYTYFEDGEVIANRAGSPQGLFEYALVTPWRYYLTGGAVVGKRGFLTAELELVNYGGARFNLTRNSDAEADAIYEGEVNQDIQDRFRNATNFRVGGEVVAGVLRFRGGLGLGISPNDLQDELNRLISAGVGYRKGRFFVDLGYRISVSEEDYTPYLTFEAPPQNVSITVTDHRLLLTGGIKF